MDFVIKYLLAFTVGGLFCVIAQILIDKTKITPARILVIYVCSGVFLSAIGVYKNLIDVAGAGATTPLTGFGHLIADGVRKGIEEQGLLGALTGGLKATAGGITASIVFAFIASLIFSSKPKR